jgi:predicted nuclease of restriction endonuclease-like (RecB) superfamily
MLEKAETESGDVVTPEEAIKDPFVLQFLDLKDESRRIWRKDYSSA